jgi:hypothetical protein
MSRLKGLLIIFVFCIIVLPISGVKATQSSGFTNQGGDWVDSFGIDRNSYAGSNGYLPNMAYETLNANAELAYNLGTQFKTNYPDITTRAEAVLKFIQTWTEYGYDQDNVVRDGVAQEEWAWNADEMAHHFNQQTGVVAIGDCEDMAFLSATMYTGAGIDAAVVNAPGHCACLVWLPDYANADYYWDLPNDDRGSGWIWSEATGGSNPLGWTPPDYSDGNWEAYPISLTNAPDIGTTTSSPGNVTPEPVTSGGFPIEIIGLGVVALVVIVVILLVSSKKKSPNQSPQNQYMPPPPPPPPPDWS